MGTAWLALAAGPSPSRAGSVEVTGDVVAQGYEVRSPWGDSVLSRRRLGTTLGLFVYDLSGERERYGIDGADYSVHLLMRLDADYGIAGSEAVYTPANPNRFVPGLERAPVDVLYGYVDGRNLGGGWFGFRVGRQYVTDALGWWSFDGALVRLTTPFYLQAELYGGLEQRGGLPLSSSRYESQGIWRGDRANLREAGLDYPSYQQADLAPAFGVALESDGINYVHGRLSYRRVYNVGETTTGQFPAPSGELARADGPRISQDRIGYAMSAFLPDIGSARGGLVYDLYNQLFSQVQGAVDVQLGSRVTLGAEVDYFVPTFDGDSIWNWFTHNPATTLLGRTSIRPLERLQLTASAGARLWMADGDPASFAQEQCLWAWGGSAAAIDRCLEYGTDPLTSGAAEFARDEDNRDTTLAPDLLANAGAAYRWGSGRAGLTGMLQQSIETSGVDRGRRVGGELTAKQALSGGRFWLGGAVSLYDWADPSREDRDATGFGYVLAPEYLASDFARMRVEFEHDMNRLVGQRFRLVGLVQLRTQR